MTFWPKIQPKNLSFMTALAALARHHQEELQQGIYLNTLVIKPSTIIFRLYLKFNTGYYHVYNNNNLCLFILE